MKIKNTIFRIIIFFITVLFIIGFKEFSKNDLNPSTSISNISKRLNNISEIIRNKKNTASFEHVNIFQLNPVKNSKVINGIINKAFFLNLDFNSLNKLIEKNPENIILQIPIDENRNVEIELTRSYIFTEDYLRKNSYTPGLYYRGIIKGNNNSLAAVSFFNDFVMGVISDENGNYVLGSLKDNQNHYTNNYIYYNDKDMLVKSKFLCMTDDIKNYNRNLKHSSSIPSNSPLTTKPIRVFFVTDYQMYLDAGNDTNAVKNFVTGMFNNTYLLYQQENVPVAISGIDVYHNPDPYINMNQSDQILKQFGNNTQDYFNGDLAHLLSTGHGGTLGGIAWINVLCASYNPNDKSGRFAFSNIDPSYNQIPTYSWTINVVTHEMGHNLASRHTHACVWPVYVNNGIGTIDSCYYNEGGCYADSITAPNNNGTMMSYCHLNGHINFLLDFGPLPGDTIREGYRLASCIDSAVNISETPVIYNLMQNYPNPFNPSTIIKFALPNDGFITITLYDMSGREITQLLKNKYFNSGIFSISLDASRFKLASGVYFYKLDVINKNNKIFSQIKKMVLLK